LRSYEKTVSWIAEEGKVEKGTWFAWGKTFFDEEVSYDDERDGNECRDAQRPAERNIGIFEEFTYYYWPWRLILHEMEGMYIGRRRGILQRSIFLMQVHVCGKSILVYRLA
jgi:hypothetical protein